MQNANNSFININNNLNIDKVEVSSLATLMVIGAVFLIFYLTSEEEQPSIKRKRYYKTKKN